MHDQLLNLKNEAISKIVSSSSPQDLEQLRILYLGKKGILTETAKQLATMSLDDKKILGPLFNDVKTSLTAAFDAKLKAKSSAPTADLDSSLPGMPPPLGHIHPVTTAISEISRIFEQIGFIRVRYPEVDWDWYAFEGLNMPKGHPARDEWETFFIDSPEDPHLGKLVLTPHTSNGQVREMERVTHPPIRMINIAKCYRRQSDISHTVMFHQFEGLVVDEGINITNLKGAIDHFTKAFFGPHRKSRLRPYHFQFTEPSFEVDVSCDICQGQGCRLCKEGWLELGGAGMVHPNVLKAGNIDSHKYTGFAFGWGVERTYMMKAGLSIPDLRLMYSNDIRFLTQF